jgi:hypothetical protein
VTPEPVRPSDYFSIPINFDTSSFSTKLIVIPPKEKLVVTSINTPYSLQDGANLLRENGSELAKILSLFLYADGVSGKYSKAYLDMPPDQQLALRQLASSGNWGTAANGYASNAALRSALLPVLGSYALSVVDMDGPRNPSQQRLVFAVQAKYNKQQQELVAAAEAKYNAWANFNKDKFSLGTVFDMSFPDFAGTARGARTSNFMAPDVIGGVVGIVAGGIAATGAAALAGATGAITSTFVMTSAAKMAATVGGPFGVAAAAVIIMGSVAFKQSSNSEKYREAYTELMASKGKTFNVDAIDLKNNTVKQDAFNAAIGVFNGVL